LKLLVHSLFYDHASRPIVESMGLPEYSYYFVFKEFLPVLESLGDVVPIEDPATEVDPLYDAALASGESCVLLTFSPPHRTPLGLRCPTMPIFAWEFDTIPNESWLDEAHQDWRYVLARCGRAITHASAVVDSVRREMGVGFPIVPVPAPVWDRFAHIRDRRRTYGALHVHGRVRIDVRSGVVIDTHDPVIAALLPDADELCRIIAEGPEALESEPDDRDGASGSPAQTRQQTRLQVTKRYAGEWYLRVLGGRRPRARSSAVEALPARLAMVEDGATRIEPVNPVARGELQKAGLTPVVEPWELRPHSVELSGVVFTAVFNPYDGRKNWMDMLTAFCTAFRDTPDATLVFKLGHHAYESAMKAMLACMARLPRFQCRVLLIHGFLEGDSFDALIQRSAFAVNASHGEGQCLPLMEFLSSGKLAVSPRHSGMLDYIDEDVGFVVDSWRDPSAWAHDPRFAYRTLRHQIDWESLVAAYRAAYRCATETPDRYCEMSDRAIERMRRHCSREEARRRLLTFLDTEGAPAWQSTA
jgi:glycosyltransferase involved in cell wall biosynthesis